MMEERILNDLESIFGENLEGLQIYVDQVGADQIRISMFWNRISVGYYARAKVFQFPTAQYERILEEEIRPFGIELGQK